MPDTKPVPTETDRIAALELAVFGPKADAAHTIIVGETVTIPIVALDASGDVQPLPLGDTFTVRPSSAGQVTVGISAVAGGPAVVVTALRPATDLLITVEDAKGLVSASERFDVVAVPVEKPAAEEKPHDPKPVALKLDVEAAVRVEPEKPAPPQGPAADADVAEAAQLQHERHVGAAGEAGDAPPQPPVEPPTA
jgi:hypothetical protein